LLELAGLPVWQANDEFVQLLNGHQTTILVSTVSESSFFETVWASVRLMASFVSALVIRHLSAYAFGAFALHAWRISTQSSNAVAWHCSCRCGSQHYMLLVQVGETGSGKTTQIAQFIAEAGYSQNRKIIACTQVGACCCIFMTACEPDVHMTVAACCAGVATCLSVMVMATHLAIEG
jgi:hypothetical protein